MSYRNLFLRSLALGVVAVPAAAGPQGGAVVAGSASIAGGQDNTTITQTSARAVLDWQSFDIGATQSVRFIQPDSSSVALNRVLGIAPSQILGSLSSNGKVFLINPNGVLFGKDAQVNVGGLLASSRNISNADFMASNLRFEGGGNGGIVNRGTIDAGSGYVALLGASVSNEGVIAARLGTVVLAAGNAFTLDVAGDGLLSFAVDAGAVHALVQNEGMISADGGHVLLTALSASQLVPSAVNNGGIIEAQTIENHAGSIRLVGDMHAGTVNVGGTLDASAPNGGDGGFIDTSAATVRFAPGSSITTAAPAGATGRWLIDPADFTIAASGGDITGAQLSTALGINNVSIVSSAGAAGTHGDINVDDTVAWSANLLTLNAQRDININTTMLGSGTASLALEYGQGALAAGNTAAVHVRAPVNLPSGNSFSTLLGSDGTVVNYSVINDMAGLQGMNGNLAGNYALGSNLDASGVTGFVPIGPIGSYGDSNRFEGTFDGLGHSISNFTMSRPSNNFVGLFGAVGGNGLVRNVGMINANITGGYDVGGIVGILFGGMSDSYATGTVTGADTVGGLVGYVDVGRITGSHANVNVSTGPNYDASSGGLVGYSYVGTIRDSFAAGSVVGGLAGGITGVNNGGLIESSYSSAAVSLNTYGQSTGGLVGTEYNNGQVVNSYWNTETSGLTNSVGGIGLTTAQLQAALPTGFSTDRWGNGDNQTTPYLLGTSGTVLIASDPSATFYNVVQNVEALQDMRSDLSGHYALVNDIDAGATRNWNGGLGFAPLGDGGTPFSGTFDGLGHAVDGLVINRPVTDDIGLFGWSVGATLRDASLTNLDITGRQLVGGWSGGFIVGYASGISASGQVRGGDSVGGLIGYNNSSQLYDSHAATDVSGGSNVGGLMGETNGGTPTARNYATGNVTGTGDSVGGLVGYSGFSFQIADSYATGNVTGDSNVGGLVGYLLNGGINTSYATGSVAGLIDVGGLVGGTGSGITTASYWNSESTGQSASAGGTALTTAQMQRRANFAGWDFATTWAGYDDHTNPLLQSFMTQLTVTAADAERTYDGQVYDGSAGAVYSIAPDFGHLAGTLAFSSGSQAGTQAINVGGLWSDQSGYVIHYVAGQQTVDPYAVSLTGTRAYDGTGDVAAGVFSMNTLVNGETLLLTGSGTTSRNVGTGNAVGTGTLVLQDGTGTASNYTLVGGTRTVDITAADLQLGTSDVSRAYDGGFGAAGVATVLSGTLFGGDSLSGGSFAFADRNAGVGKSVSTSGVSVLDGNGGGNYHVTYADNTTSTITRAVLGATATAAGKTYDGNTLANATLVITGLVGAETLGVSNVASFNSKDVATANLVTVDGITLADGSGGGLAANYTLATGQTAIAHITPLALSAAAAAADKVYDGNTAANATLTLSGLVGAETVGVGTLASFNSKNVATANLVTIDSTTLVDGSGGGLATNYTLAAGQTAVAHITPLALSASASAASKVYDGNTAANATLTLSGLVGAETVGASTLASFNSKNVADASLVTIDGITLTDGSGGGLAGNYALVAGQTAIAHITPLALSAAATAASKVYDGNTSANTTLTLGGLVGTETLGVSTQASFNSKNVTTANLVTIDGTTLVDGGGGGLAANYTLAAGQTAVAHITPRALSAAAAAADKVYDGNTLANATLTLSGLVGAETLGVSTLASFNTKDVATANLVTVGSNTLADGSGGGLAANYILAAGQTAVAHITPRSLTVVGQVALPKVYDGTTAAMLSGGSLSGVVAGEVVGLSEAGEFASANPGDGIAVTATNSLGQPAAVNYTLIQPTGLSANITAPVVEIPVVDVRATPVYQAALAQVATAASGSITSKPLALTALRGQARPAALDPFNLAELDLRIVLPAEETDR